MSISQLSHHHLHVLNKFLLSVNLVTKHLYLLKLLCIWFELILQHQILFHELCGLNHIAILLPIFTIFLTEVFEIFYLYWTFFIFFLFEYLSLGRFCFVFAFVAIKWRFRWIRNWLFLTWKTGNTTWRAAVAGLVTITRLLIVNYINRSQVF